MMGFPNDKLSEVYMGTQYKNTSGSESVARSLAFVMTLNYAYKQRYVDSSFTLVEDKRGSGKATLSCIGRDIEYRELTLERNAENVWELVSDSRTQPELLALSSIMPYALQSAHFALLP